MNKLLASLLLILWAASAQAQIANPGGLGAICPGGGALCNPIPRVVSNYPCDQPGFNCAHAWGAEQLTASFSGNLANACLVATPATCTNVPIDNGSVYTSNKGGLDIATLTTFGCSVSDTTCYAKILYDQYTGTPCDATNSTSGSPNGPFIQMQSGTLQNGHPQLFFNAYGSGQIARLYCTLSTGSADPTLVMEGTGYGGVGTGYFANVSDNNLTNGLFLAMQNAGTFNATTEVAGTGYSSSGSSITNSTQYCMVGTTTGTGAGTQTQGILDTTPDTLSSAFNNTIAAQTHFGIGSGYTGGLDLEIGHVNAIAYFSSPLSNANAETVGHLMGAFWVASNPC